MLLRKYLGGGWGHPMLMQREPEIILKISLSVCVDDERVVKFSRGRAEFSPLFSCLLLAWLHISNFCCCFSVEWALHFHFGVESERFDTAD